MSEETADAPENVDERTWVVLEKVYEERLREIEVERDFLREVLRLVLTKGGSE